MRALAILFCLILDSAVGFSQTAEFSFLSPTTHTWEKTHEGEILEHYFVYKNTGNAPLVMENVEVACNCTTVKPPVLPTLPGAIDSIYVQFNTDQTYYGQNRTIIIEANTPKKTKLRIKTYVIPREE